jgi:vacuolar protein sorting-associated protein 18
MALDSNGYVAARGLQDLDENALPIFNVEKVSLQFSIASDFVAAQVANNVLVLALSNGRILRIDLDNPADIDGMRFVLHALLLLTLAWLRH